MRSLTLSFIHWMLWAEAHGKTEVVDQVRNNLWNTAQRIGIPVSNWNASGWEWARAYLTLHKGAFREFSKDPRRKTELFKLLIGLLEENLKQQQEILKQLQEITGKDLGSSPAAWRLWLEREGR
jgi:hypothetical protein